MDNFVIGNMVWNAGLVAVAGLFVKKWMKDVEDGRKINATRISEDASWTRSEISRVTDKITTDVKEAIHDNRVEYTRQSAEINGSIRELSSHVAAQNGRVGRMESDLKVQIALCKQRELLAKGTSCNDTDRNG